ncbi:unnamed protein product [Mytilus edulis]|uniref:Reverse transcriptase domain-containing protein n=2 Tax=Mytilus TaxID=6548 RepID=A0A8S3SR44_MYTED|nr:unnamed protein product [Mytilus edulis]
MVRTAHGYSAETLPFVETISPQLRKNIISGMDINLTSLLIPYYSGSGTHELSLSEDKNNKSDPRSSRSLSLGEFIQAFGIYKNIMCTTFPHRRSELDLYERDLVDMATRYPGKGFYEYHKRFSADAAAHLRHNNIPVDWSIRNNTLFCNIFANIKPNTCSICGSTFHSSSYCNQSNNSNRNTTGSYRSDQDIHGRERSYHGGKEICNNFNGKTGCFRPHCRNLHICLSCNGEHPKTVCTSSKNEALGPNKIGSNMQRRINLVHELENHPNKEFKNYLVSGLSQGFSTGITTLPSKSIECKNLRSALSQPTHVLKLIETEVEKGYLEGPFDFIPFTHYRINPIGVAEGKYNKKKRLIVDLSAPHEDPKNPSLNELIDKDEFSLQYVSIDDAIRTIKSLGFKSWLLKTDIADAFKVMPLSPMLWPFHGIKWDDRYYFFNKLVFGCRSSPKIFDTLSQAICWIAQNNYNIEHILHLLDDFLVIVPEQDNAQQTMNTFLDIFKSLGVPLSFKKTEGPCHKLEYLGIFLDTINMEAYLPLEKVLRIQEIIEYFSKRNSCTKRELLSLLGHLNFACRVIVPGRSFVSHLIKLSTTVKKLHHHVHLKSCKPDLVMWSKFLKDWNGVSFFLNDNITNAADIHLFTDATPSSFGGFYQNEWFQGDFPYELLSCEQTSMAFFELYPIVMACVLWGDRWKRKRILFNCDNLATVDIIKKGRSKIQSLMKLMRKLTYHSAINNFVVHAKHIPDDEVQSLGTTCKRDTNSLSASLRADDGLNLKIDELWDASLSESTRLTYKSAFKCFRTFLVMNGQPCSEVNLPYVKEDLLVYFVTYCQKALNLKHQTIKLYLAGVRHYYIRFLGYDPMANAIRLPVILRGIKKSQNNVVQERLPITSSILNKLCALLSKGIFSPVLDLMFQCAFKMAFFGFLRCGEFTCRSYNDNSCTVLLQDITVDPTKQFFIFRLRSSKRDPFRQGVNITIYENDTFKPVDTMNKYLSIRYNNGALPKSPLFVEDEFQSSPLSRETFISSLRQLLDILGYNTVKFCGHSFRIGAATSAAACGVEDHIIQTLGRWSSDCYIRYIRTDAKVLKRAQHDMCFHN